MADIYLPPSGGHADEGSPADEDARLKERRRFLKRTAILAPLVLATVQARSVWAQEPLTTLAAGCASMGPSGWRPPTPAQVPSCGPPTISSDPFLDPAATPSTDPGTTTP